MTARLFCKYGPLAGADFQINDDATIGRGDDNTIQLDNGSVSSQHARIFYDKDSGRYVLEDLGSLNGTRLDGVPVHNRERLEHLHLITFVNDLDFIFQDHTLCQKRGDGVASAKDQKTKAKQKTRSKTATGEEHTPAPEPEPPKNPTLAEALPAVLPAALRGVKPAKDKAPRDDKQTAHGLEMPVLPTNLAGKTESVENTSGEETSQGAPFYLVVYLDENMPPRRFPLHDGSQTVGRSAEADVSITSNEISRTHAKLTVENDQVFVEDAGSTNRTYIGETVVEGRVPVPLDQKLYFGKVSCSLERGNA